MAPRIGWSACCLGLLVLALPAWPVQAGLLDLLFGGGGNAGPQYYERAPFASPYNGQDPYNGSGARQPRTPPVEIPPMRMESLCCKNGEDPMKALLSDDTLLHGDVVMTPQGLRTFVGARAPHSMRDFVPTGRGRSVSSSQRRQFYALDR